MIALMKDKGWGKYVAQNKRKSHLINDNQLEWDKLKRQSLLLQYLGNSIVTEIVGSRLTGSVDKIADICQETFIPVLNGIVSDLQCCFL